MKIKYMTPFPINEVDIGKQADQIPVDLIPPSVEIPLRAGQEQRSSR